MKKIVLKILLFVLLLVVPSLAFGSPPALPEVMIGQTTLTVQDPTVPSIAQTFYGGIAGNETVLNYVAPGQIVGKRYAPSLNLDGTQSSPITFGIYSPIYGTGPFAHSFWIKTSQISTGNDRNIILMLGTHGQGLSYVALYQGYITLETISGAIGSTNINDYGTNVVSSSSISDSRWHHVTAQRQSDGTGKIWVDGVDVTQSISSRDNPNNKVNITRNNAVKLGYSDLSPNFKKFSGSLDEIKTFTKALSSSEISALYTETSADDSMVGYWNFSEGGETGNGLVKDKTYGHADGTLVTGTSFNSLSGPVAINPDDENTGYDIFGFNKDYLQGGPSLTGCVAGIILNIMNPQTRCFVADSKNSNVSVMTSRTFVGSSPATSATEVAALLYPPKPLLVGDAYLGSSDPNNFAYWGRNLTQSSGTASEDSFLGVGNYTGNANAQAKLSGSEYEKYKAKVDLIRRETIAAASLPNGTWYLQSTGGTNSNLITDSTDGLAKYPDGRLWTNNVTGANLALSGSYAYTGHGSGPGNGTIIVKGDVTIGPDTTIDRAVGDNSSRLGIIVDGNVTIGANCNIRAAIFATGDITITGDNVNLLGSFVAQDFPNLTSRSNVHFYYDAGLDSAWPPGFKDLQMPHPVE